jgi:IS5 family transposase
MREQRSRIEYRDDGAMQQPRRKGNLRQRGVRDSGGMNEERNSESDRVRKYRSAVVVYDRKASRVSN